MSKQLVNVAMANAIFEKKKNFIDTYFPFVLKAFENETSCTILDLSNSIKQIFDFELPINSIKDVLTKRENKIFHIHKKGKYEWHISLTAMGMQELSSVLNQEKVIEENLNHFYSSFIQYCQEELNIPNISISKAERIIQNFISSNLTSLSISKAGGEETKPFDSLDKFEKYIVLFLADSREHDEAITRSFDDMWKGMVIWNELKKADLSKTPIGFKKKLVIYIDTNFVVSLLNLHHPSTNKAAEELYRLMDDTPNLEIRILDITIREIGNLLDNYTFLRDHYHDIEVNSIFFFMKKKGLSLIDLEKIKSNLSENLLKNFNIVTDDTTDLLHNEEKWQEEIFQKLYEQRTKYNDRKPERIRKKDTAIQKNAYHDSRAITHVLKYKSQFATSIENCKCIFLTGGFLMSRQIQKICSKWESYPSVIFDGTLTNILYLKSPQPSSGITVDQVLKAHSKYLMIDSSVWEEFFLAVKSLRDKDQISIEDYSLLISSNQHTQRLLMSVEPNSLVIETDEITSILQKIRQETYEQKQHIEHLTKATESQELEIRVLREQKVLEKGRVEELEKQIVMLQEDQKKDELEGVIELKNRLKELEKEKSKQEYEKAVERYNSELEAYTDAEWLKILKELKYHLKFELIILLVAIIFCAIILGLGATYVPSLKSYFIAIPICLFFVTHFSKYIDFNKVLLGWKLLLKSTAEKLESLEKERISNEFISNHKKPKYKNFQKKRNKI